MCLDKITEVYKPSLYNLWIPKFAYKSGVGWKLFFCDNARFPLPNLVNIYKGSYKSLPIGVWLDEKKYRDCFFKDRRLINMGLKLYPNYSFGWHILEEEPPDDCLYINRQVEYKYGHTAGIDATYKAPTIVAKYMKILEE